MTVWSLSSLKEAGYSHRIVTGILHSDPVPSCKDRRHSLCEGGPSASLRVTNHMNIILTYCPLCHSERSEESRLLRLLVPPVQCRSRLLFTVKRMLSLL